MGINPSMWIAAMQGLRGAQQAEPPAAPSLADLAAASGRGTGQRAVQMTGPGEKIRIFPGGKYFLDPKSRQWRPIAEMPMTGAVPR